MRPENKKMQAFLSKNGIKATPKYIEEGSMRGCWRLCDHKQKWTLELQERLTRLDFFGFDYRALNQYSGNGGLFSVFVRRNDDYDYDLHDYH